MLKRFRFSLLSLLVGVVLAGGVVWLNMRAFGVFSGEPAHGYPHDPVSYVARSYGWPCLSLRVFITFDPKGTEAENERRRQQPHYRWKVPGLAANIAIGFAIVFCGAGSPPKNTPKSYAATYPTGPSGTTSAAQFTSSASVSLSAHERSCDVSHPAAP